MILVIYLGQSACLRPYCLQNKMNFSSQRIRRIIFTAMKLFKRFLNKRDECNLTKGGQQSWVKRWGRTRGCITGVRLLFWTFSIKNPLETLSQCAEVHGSKMALSLSLKAKTSFYALIKKLKTVAYFMSRIFSNNFNSIIHWIKT